LQFLWTSCLVFQNWNGWTILKFHMQQDKMYIYRMIPKLKYLCVVCFSERYTKSQNSDFFQFPQSQQCIHLNPTSLAPFGR
jgi:hypothetical protein